MARSDQVIADSEAVLRRISPEGRRHAQRARQRRFTRRMRAGRRILAALAAIVAAVFAWGLIVGPIGQMGFLLAVVLAIVATVVILFAGREPEETPATLAASDLPLLPARTEAWLQRQRPMLPPPAQRLADGIGVRLEALAPQLAALDPADPAAQAARKLLATELPELIDGYTRVPAGLRAATRDGPSPDQQLAQALGVVDAQLAEMSADLAAGDLRKLATQGRFLELKYKDNEQG